jgi:hypothetical protein
MSVDSLVVVSLRIVVCLQQPNDVIKIGHVVSDHEGEMTEFCPLLSRVCRRRRIEDLELD